MDSPFFTNRRWYQQPNPTHAMFRPSSVRGVPIHHIDPVHSERASAPKVVRIPVQFIGSERVDRTGSAVKIQKVFRGFMVRKSLLKIKDIRLQVDEIEERLTRDDVLHLLKKDAKERLRINESLMALLLKLDSICGVDFGVRACRKDVIRKAISLQERIDAIVATDLDPEENVEIVGLEGEAKSVCTANSNDSCLICSNSEKSVDVPSEGEIERDMEVEGSDDEVGIVDVGVDCEVKVGEASGSVNGKEGKGADESKSDGELLEKMIKENEKMMSMMSQLYERSETQTRMLNGLMHRVELLEKAFVCDKLRRKKKGKANLAAATASR